MREEILNYFNGDNLATDVFINKYSLERTETPDEMHNRLANDFAKVEDKYNHYPDNIKKHFNDLSEYGKKRYSDLELISNSKNYILSLFKDFKFIIPGGSVMQGLGNKKPISLSNCFVLPSPDDNIEGIYNSIKDIAQISKRRGGVGIDISTLRPRGCMVNNANKTSTGAVSFMEAIDKATEVIGQEGRRRALMISINVNHPDIFEFVNVKKDLTKITGANISVRLNNEFLEAVKADRDYLLTYPNISEKELLERGFCKSLDELYNDLEYNKLYNNEAGGVISYIKKIRARELWDNIITNAHLTAEPGIFNWNRLIDYDPTGVYDELKPISTNPCGELGLSGYDSCRLIATNLYSLVKYPFTEKATLDTELAYKIFYEAQILADDLVDLELEAVNKILNKIDSRYLDSDIDNPSDEFKLWLNIKKIGSKGRRTGTGITAYADMLAALNKKYGDAEVTEKLFKIKLQAELDASTDMSILRGAFPLWDKSKEFSVENTGQFAGGEDYLKGKNSWYEFISSYFPEQAERIYKFGRRNAGISTIAPTGTVSIMTQTSSGIEPVFMPIYKRKVTCQGDEKPDIIEQGIGYKIIPIIHPKLKEWYKIVGYQVMEQYLGEGLDKVPTVDELDIDGWEFLYRYSPYYLQSSVDIDYNVRVSTQSLIQRYITSSISSTVNLPKDIKKEVVEDLYLKAFNRGCKGITVYRDGSRGGILVKDNNKEEFIQHTAPKRPKELKAELHISQSRGHYYYIIIGLFENKPYEVFITEILLNQFEFIKKYLEQNNISVVSGIIDKIKKNHYSFKSDVVQIDKLVEGNNELEKACALYTSMLLRHGASIYYVIKTAKKINDSITSFVSVMCRVLNKYNNIKEELTCEVCGGKVIKEGGCSKCVDCGNSKCD